MRRALMMTTAAAILLPAAAQAQVAAPAPQYGEGTGLVTQNPVPPGQSTASQEVQPAAVTDQREGDIIVTATRRDTRLADTPLAISAVTQETLQNSGANDIRALNQLAPSLLISSTGSEANASARIRGVGTVGDNPGLESSVAVFIDGVYRSRTGVGLNELGELERVEVLRGPQGTLFGRNASAGLLNIVTRAPSTRDFEGYLEGSYGNYDAYRLAGAVSVPVISDVLGVRVDGVYNKRDGFFEDVNTGYEINNRDRYFVRAQALFEPTSNLTLRLIGDYSRREEDCCAAVYTTPEIAGTNFNLITPANPIVGVLTQVAGTNFAGYFPSINDPYDRKVAITPGRNYEGETEDYGGSAQIDYDLGSVQLTSITAYREYSNFQAADADYGLADLLNFLPDSGRTFKTFTQELRAQGTLFDDRLDWLVGGFYSNEDLTTQSQLQFGSQYGTFAACRLLATISPGIPRAPGNAGCLAGPGGAITSAVLSGIFPDPAGATVGAQPFIAGLRLLSQVANVGDDTANFNQNSENFAFFTHNIFHVTDRFDVTLGLRYTNETKKLDANFNNTNTICPQVQALILPFLTGAAATTVPASLTGGVASLACQGNSSSALNGITLDDQRDEDEFTGTAVVSYKATDDLLVYASYARGYKAGGFNLDRSAFTNPAALGPLPIFPVNPAAADTYAAGLQFDQETVNAYEIGLKYATRSFSLNLIGFRSEFTNFQLNTFNGTVFLVQNINGCDTDLGTGDNDLSATTGACDPDDTTAGLIAQGVELETTLVPMRDLRFVAGVTYASTKYADNLVGSDQGVPLDPQLRLLPGQQNSNAPKLVGTLSANFSPEVTASGVRALFYVDSRLSDGYNTGSDLFPQKEQESFVTVNARVGLRGPDQRWAIELWSQNLLNAEYTQVTFSSPFQATGANAAYPAAQYPGGTQIFSSYLAEPRTYGVTLRTRF